MTDPELEARVREWLGQDHRFEHCRRVAAFAVDLARVHGIDERQAYLAAMLHDLARLYPAKRLLEECEQRNIPIDAYARENPIVLHAPLSAALAAETFGVTDTQVLSAIAKHTLAGKEMSPLDAVVYLADTLEPGRTFEARERLAALAKTDLFGCLRVTIENSLRYLQESRIAPAPQTAQALESKHWIEKLNIVELVRDAALDKKADELVEIDVAGRTIIADTFVLLTGRSKIQTRSIADSVVERVKGAGLPVSRMEGYADGNWILIDLGPVIVHVFTPEQRAFYNLERLWSAPAAAQAQSS